MKYKNWLLIIVLFFSVHSIMFSQNKSYSVDNLEFLAEYFELYNIAQQIDFDSSSVVDSIILEGEVSKYKYSYSYDSDWNVLTFKDERFANNRWENSIRKTSFYNEDNKLTKDQIEIWDETQWVLSTVNYYYYDESNNLIQIFFESANGNHDRWNYTYNLENQKTSFTWEVYQNDSWINYKKELYTYHESGEIWTHKKQYWENSQWNNSSMIEKFYSYNLNEKLDTIFVNYFSGPFLNFDGSGRTIYFYNPNLDLKTKISEVMHGNNWENKSRKNFTYDSDHNLIFVISENWGDYNQDTSWVNFTRQEYAYDNNNNMILGKHYIWEGYWVPRDYFAELNFYDSFGRFYSLPWMQIEVFYSNTVTNTEELDTYPNGFELFQNYPNPFNPTTTINYSIPKRGFVSLKVYNTLGNVVANLVNKEQPRGNYNVNFDASKLTSGVYFYTLISGDFTETKKLVLLK